MAIQAYSVQIERRLAPFWKGLNDHSDTWTEHQLVAVVNGLPLPAPDEIPPEEPPKPSNNLSTEWNPRASSSSNINNLTVPITSRSLSQGSDRSASLSASHPAFSSSSPMSGTTPTSPFFRGRAKTLAALTTGSRNSSQTEMTPQEIQLPKDPYINGQRIEVFLYKDAAECPICFLYYPPYLNKTRCCDQPICSECFVQIKRPDPHPPEHHDPPDANAPPQETQDEIQLVSEPAACPFCVQPEFGVTYEPPPFRRGLVYANSNQNHLANAASAMSSSTSLNSQGVVSPGRRRATSLAANDSTVITTDRVRPDWSKKLADARAHALRRAAAATALHNAAYMMGNLEASGSRGFSLGRRRRNVFGSDSAGSSGHGTPRRDSEGPSSSTNDIVPGRGSSRRPNRLEDLEELMMMEAIRLSLAAEEERKKREEKEAAKEAKKEEKRKAKEAKKAEKSGRKSSYMHPSSSTHNVDGEAAGEHSSAAVSSGLDGTGKGKGVDRSAMAFNPLTEPTSTLNNSDYTAQEPDPGDGRDSERQSDVEETPNDTPGTEPMFNFNALQDRKEDDADKPQYIENVNAQQGGFSRQPSQSQGEPFPSLDAEEENKEAGKIGTPDIAVYGPDYIDESASVANPLLATEGGDAENGGEAGLEASMATIKPSQDNSAAPPAVSSTAERTVDTKNISDLDAVDQRSHQHEGVTQ